MFINLITKVTKEVIMQELTLQDLFKIRDALMILDRYGMVEDDLKQEVDEEIQRLSKDKVVLYAE